MHRKLLIGLIAGVVLVVVGVILFNSVQTVIIDSNGNLGRSMGVDALVMATSIERTADATRGGGSNPYPTYEISGLELIAQATPNGSDTTGPTGEYPRLGSTQSVAGHALIGPITPVPDLDGQFLAGLSVWSTGFESDGLPPWHFGWLAHILGDGDVQIYEGGADLWDSQLASLAGLLGRTDQADLILDWVAERHAERAGAATGPLTLAFAAAFLPPEEPPPPMPSLEVPLLVKVEAPVSADSIDKVLVRPGGLVADEFVPAERLLAEGSGTMTAIMLPEDRMEIEVWDDDIPMAGTALEFADWETTLSGDAGGVAITITQDEQGTYSVTAEILSIPDYNQALAEATN